MYHVSMSELLPGILARSRRGLCPTCGAALDLRGEGRLVTCGFCGTQSGVERRLRTVDGDLKLEELDARDADTSDAHWLAIALGEEEAEKVTCPGCGDAFEGDLAHDILRCASCGMQCKVERRMVRPEAEERRPPERRTRVDFEKQFRGDTSYRWDVQTEQLVWRILNETDVDRRVAYALKFEDWCFINPTTVYFLPWLLAVAKEGDVGLAGPICDCVGKLLCQEDERLFAPILEACEPFALDTRGPVEMLHVIGLGNARGMRLLLDAADAAARAGATEYAANALWAAHTIIERNYDEHPVVAQIMLYRLFYLSPVPMGWVLYVLRSGEGGYVFKDPYALLGFIDDCAFERPELVAYLSKRPYAEEVSDLEELLVRRAFIDGLLSKAAKGAALGALLNLAEGAPEEVVSAAVAYCEPWLDDPELCPAATARLRQYIKDGDGIAPPLVGLICKRTYTLPEILQRQVHWKIPDNDLLDFTKIPPYYDGDPEEVVDPVVTRALEAYDAAIRDAVDRREERRGGVRDLWERCRGLDVRLFED